MQHSTSTCCCGSTLELILQTTCTRVEPRQDLRSLRHPRCVHASARALRSSAALFPSAAAEWAKPSRSAAALRRLACEILILSLRILRSTGRARILPPDLRAAHSQTLRFVEFHSYIWQKVHGTAAQLRVSRCIYRRGASSICTKPTPQQHLLFLSLYILKMCTGVEPQHHIKHIRTVVDPQQHFPFDFKMLLRCVSGAHSSPYPHGSRSTAGFAVRRA